MVFCFVAFDRKYVLKMGFELGVRYVGSNELIIDASVYAKIMNMKAPKNMR